MKKNIVLKMMVLLMILTSCKIRTETPTHFSEQALLIHNANIINVEDGSIMDQRAILIDSGKIKLMGDYSELKSKVEADHHFDVGNKFIIPGLWDMHVHIEGEDLVQDNLALFPVFIAYGITTVRDMASDLGEQVLKWREDINNDKFLGPQIFTAGRKLEGKNSIWKGDLEIENEKELNEMLDKLEGYDVDLVKITENTLSGPLFLKSVEEAHNRGFMVSAHIPLDLNIEQVVDAGLTIIEHANYLVRLGSDEKKIVEQVISGKITNSEANDLYFTNFDQDTANYNYHKMGEKHLAVTPTLIGGKQLAYLDEDSHSEDEFLQYLTQRFTSKYQWRIDRMAGEGPKEKQIRKERYKLIAQQIPYIQKSGIKILAGSDSAALNTYVYPALSLHQELQLLQNAGLTPLQVLQSATINGAELMEKLNTMATIEENKEADLVILNSNPLLDIKATQDIYAVVNDGKLFKRADLDLILKKAKETKERLDKERQ